MVLDRRGGGSGAEGELLERLVYLLLMLGVVAGAGAAIAALIESPVTVLMMGAVNAYH